MTGDQLSRAGVGQNTIEHVKGTGDGLAVAALGYSMCQAGAVTAQRRRLKDALEVQAYHVHPDLAAHGTVSIKITGSPLRHPRRLYGTPAGPHAEFLEEESRHRLVVALARVDETRLERVPR